MIVTEEYSQEPNTQIMLKKSHLLGKLLMAS